jgi:dTDP-L-rhamnose 4-epimerase
LIFEDGQQRRDFVSVHDVVQACTRALEQPGADGRAVNVGSGRNVSVLEVARSLAKVLGREEVVPALAGKFRVGDIRHCFADISLAREALGYEPQIPLEQGMADLAEWLEDQVVERDHVEAATAELQARGLTL